MDQVLDIGQVLDIVKITDANRLERIWAKIVQLCLLGRSTCDFPALFNIGIQLVPVSSLFPILNSTNIHKN